MKVELNADWSEFLCALIARRVRFMLIGGHAVAGHGEPRFTEDLDVLVEPTLPNARRLRSALSDFGFGVVAPSVAELAKADKVFMLGRKPFRIDILTGIDGVSFREAWRTRVEASFVATPLYVIGRAALIKNKLAAGRGKDLLDVAMLEMHAPAERARARARRPSSKRSPSTPARKRART